MELLQSLENYIEYIGGENIYKQKHPKNLNINIGAGVDDKEKIDENISVFSEQFKYPDNKLSDNIPAETDEENDTEKWVLYGKESCPFAQNAIKIIKEKGFDVDCIDIYKLGYDKVLELLKKGNYELPNFDTTPIVYRNGKLIGQSSDVVKYFT